MIWPPPPPATLDLPSHGLLLHAGQTTFPIIPRLFPQLGIPFILRPMTVHHSRQLKHHLLHDMFLRCSQAHVPSLLDCWPLYVFIYLSRYSNCLRNMVVYIYIFISNRKGNNWEGRISYFSVLQCLEQGLVLSTCQESVISLAFQWMSILYIMLLAP